MNAKKFVDVNQNSVWTKELADGRTQTSVCVEVNDEVLDLNTGYIREEKSLVWLKGMSSEVVLRQQENVIKMVNNGTLKPFRAFSKTPFYDGQEEDINPQTEAKLGRYSQVRLCPADQHATLHRQYVTVATAPPAVAETEQPAIKAEA
jgi:hypothetical protein